MALKREIRNSSWYILFFIWPFGVLIKSLTKLKNPHTKNIIWFFTAFLGLSFVIHSDGLDAYRYAQEFERIASNNLTLNEIFKLQFIDGKSLDFYKPIMVFLVSRVSENPKIYYFFIALIYGYFFSRNFYYVVSLIKGNLSKYQILLIYVFLFVIPFQDFQFIRFTTAAHVFFFGSFPYLIEKKKHKILWVLLSMFIHFSFFVPIGVFIIYLILPKKTTPFFVFYIVSIFFVELNLETINTFLVSYAPDILQDKATTYGRAEYAERVAESFASTNWYIKFNRVAIDLSLLILLSALFHLRKALFWENHNLRNPFIFVLLLLGFANLISAFPSGFRFIALGRLFAAALIIISTKSLSGSLLFYISKKITVPLLLFFLIISLRYFIDFTGISTYFGNPFSVLIIPDKSTIINLIKNFII